MINKGFRIPDHFTLEDALEHPKYKSVLSFASNVKMKTKYDCRFIDANFTKENWFFAVMASPELGKKSTRE